MHCSFYCNPSLIQKNKLIENILKAFTKSSSTFTFTSTTFLTSIFVLTQIFVFVLP